RASDYASFGSVRNENSAGFYAEQRPSAASALQPTATDLDDDCLNVDEDFEPRLKMSTEGSDDSEVQRRDRLTIKVDGEEDRWTYHPPPPPPLEDTWRASNIDGYVNLGWRPAPGIGTAAPCRQIASRPVVGCRARRPCRLRRCSVTRTIRLPNRRGAGNRRSTAAIDGGAPALQAREGAREFCPADMTNSKRFVESRLRQEGGLRRLPVHQRRARHRKDGHLADMPDLPPFDTVLVNGMKVTEPKRVYSAIVRQLHKVRALADSPPPAQVGVQQRQRASLRAAVDELDMLCNRRQDVLYNLFEWPQNPNSRLNRAGHCQHYGPAERVLVHRVASRLGLSRLVRALEPVQPSCDLAEQEFGPQQMQRMNLQMFAGPVITAVANQLSEYERSLLRACLSQRLESGRDETAGWPGLALSAQHRQIGGLPMAQAPVGRSLRRVRVCAVCGPMRRVHAAGALGTWRAWLVGSVINCSPQDKHFEEQGEVLDFSFLRTIKEVTGAVKLIDFVLLLRKNSKVCK
uniref:Origin recognition complex subunit 1 n=1 Tax=Macrostomum lignano TaxID=282301 RepID=A0A1I8FP75_9PLAT